MVSDGQTVLLRVGEAAERLSLSRATVYELINSGRLSSVTIGRSRRISVKALDDFVELLGLEGARGGGSTAA
jgi:excisionase family DNA binding protein